MTIAIIGAGMAGLACAQALNAAGVTARVFDKGRGPGGRMSTRRADPWQFDHGTQYFTARDPGFREQVDAWSTEGLVQPWVGRFVALSEGSIAPHTGDASRYVGVPQMNTILRQVANQLEVSVGVCVSRLVREENHWRLLADSGKDLGTYTAVLVAVPPPQAARLLEVAPAIAERTRSVAMKPCWAVMLGFPQPIDQPFDGAFVTDPVLAWVARNNSKPGRADVESWVLHATPDWSSEHVQEPGEQVCSALLDAFGKVIGGLSVSPASRTAHRWLFAAPITSLGEAYLYDAALSLGVCGDWCLGPRVEAAWLSGRALAINLLANMK